MYNKSHDTAYARVVGSLCVCILCIILVIGLWPFHAPKNQVRWLNNGDGLHFGRYGTVVSSGTFQTNPVNDSTSGTIELWLEPENLLSNSHTILSFYGSEHPGAPFWLHQYKNALVVHQNNIDSQGTVTTAWLTIHGVFREKRPSFVTIALRKGVTSVYLDGSLVKLFPILGTSTNNFTGRLMVANSPNVSDSWSGRILGLAIYDRQLTPAQIAQHYESWTKNQRPALAQDEAPVALYLFNERAGNIVHNQLNLSTDLIVPTHYFVLHPGLLRFPWREYHATWSYWEDVSVNIAGFIPLGFCVVAYFSSVCATKRAAAITIVLGFVTSLAIEILQAFLPTRSSGVTDIITNTLGTAIGVMLYRWSFTQILLTKARQYGISANLSKDTGSESVMVSSNSI
jgi:hypothetical protein